MSSQTGENTNNKNINSIATAAATTDTDTTEKDVKASDATTEAPKTGTEAPKTGGARAPRGMPASLAALLGGGVPRGMPVSLAALLGGGGASRRPPSNEDDDDDDGGASNAGSDDASLQAMLMQMASGGGCGNPSCRGCGGGSSAKIAKCPAYQAWTKVRSDQRADPKLDDDTFGHLPVLVTDEKSASDALLNEINRINGLTKWTAEQRAVVVYNLATNKRWNIVTQIATAQPNIFTVLPFANDIANTAVQVNDVDVKGLTLLCDVMGCKFTDAFALHYEKKGRVAEVRYIVSRSPTMRMEPSDADIAIKGGFVDLFRYIVTEHKVLPRFEPLEFFTQAYELFSEGGSEVDFTNRKHCLRVLIETKNWTPDESDLKSIPQLAVRQQFIRDVLPDGFVVTAAAPAETAAAPADAKDASKDEKH